MQHFIENWGYLAVFLGSMIEGESIILTAGFLAHEGFLSLPHIIFISFIGTLVADQGLYHIGRHYGQPLLNKFPNWKQRADRAFNLLHRYQNFYILSFRFIYGIRIISPIIIGISGVSFKRFTLLNLLAAIIWSILSCCAGYFFADIITDHLHYLPKIILGIAIVLGFVFYYYYRKLQKRRPI